MTNFVPFSKKQLTTLTWWCNHSKHKNYDAIICDGAVRSGKTLCMSISFVFWSLARFNNQSFAICGKTVTSLRRNVITPLINALSSLGFAPVEKVSKNYIEITYLNRQNRFYLFGGKDESSASLIQGVTLAGVMFDEVALMPRSFVEQALARCSIEGSKFWFNCNPEHPFHWFYLEWIKKLKQKNSLYLHFLMEDNPSLSTQVLKRYKSIYSGAFYERFVLGKWTAHSGLVYPMFDPRTHVVSDLPKHFQQHYISCDYGITNPASFGLWGLSKNIWYRIEEYYHDSKLKGSHKTDEEYYTELEKLAQNRQISSVIVDPSASSFIECIKRHGKFKVIAAKNDVLGGIRLVGDCLTSGKIKIASCCKDTIREFALYCWDENSKSDTVKKANDHAMDDVRYFVNNVLKSKNDSFFVLSASREQ